MANNCYFEAQITGLTKESVKAMCEAMREYRWGDGYNFNPIEYHADTQTYVAYVSGDCAWSIQSSMTDNGLVEDTAKYDVIFEAYSSESGMGFQEHLLIYTGNVDIDDCIDTIEVCTDDYENVEELNKENNTDFTEADFENASNGWLKTGGIANWGEFEDFDHEQWEV